MPGRDVFENPPETKKSGTIRTFMDRQLSMDHDFLLVLAFMLVCVSAQMNATGTHSDVSEAWSPEI